MKSETWIPAALALVLVGASASAQNNGGAGAGRAGAGRAGVRPGATGAGGRVGAGVVTPGTVGTRNPRAVSGQSRFQPSTGGFYGGGGYYINGVPQNAGGVDAGDQANTGGQQQGATTRGANGARRARRGSDRVRFGPRAQAELRNPPGAFRPGQKAVNAAARGERAPGPDPVISNGANDPLAWRDSQARTGGRFGPRAQQELSSPAGALRPGQGDGAGAEDHQTTQRMQAIMRNRPMTEGRVVGVSPTSVDVRYTVYGKSVTRSFSPEQVFMFRNNGELATAISEGNILQGDQVMVPRIAPARSAVAGRRQEMRGASATKRTMSRRNRR